MQIGGVMRVKLVTAGPEQTAAEAIRLMFRLVPPSGAITLWTVTCRSRLMRDKFLRYGRPVTSRYAKALLTNRPRSSTTEKCMP